MGWLTEWVLWFCFFYFPRNPFWQHSNFTTTQAIHKYNKWESWRKTNEGKNSSLFLRNSGNSVLFGRVGFWANKTKWMNHVELVDKIKNGFSCWLAVYVSPSLSLSSSSLNILPVLLICFLLIFSWSGKRPRRKHEAEKGN